MINCQYPTKGPDRWAYLLHTSSSLSFLLKHPDMEQHVDRLPCFYLQTPRSSRAPEMFTTGQHDPLCEIDEGIVTLALIPGIRGFLRNFFLKFILLYGKHLLIGFGVFLPVHCVFRPLEVASIPSAGPSQQGSTHSRMDQTCITDLDMKVIPSAQRSNKKERGPVFQCSPSKTVPSLPSKRHPL